MKDSKKESVRWWKQGENDYKFAKVGLGEGFFSQTREIMIEEKIVEELVILDQYYIPTRYPNGLPDLSPFEAYTKKQGEEALRITEILLDLTLKRIS